MKAKQTKNKKNMPTITIPKREYKALLDVKLQYERLFSPPPTRDSKAVVSSFRKTGRYNEKFLKSLGKGLKRSIYFKTA